MTKDQIKTQIKSIQLDPELEKLLFELIDGAAEVNDTLLNTIADILDMQADFYEESADILEETSEMYKELKEDMELIDLETEKAKVELRNKNMEEIIEGINQKIEDFKNNNSQSIQN